MGPATRRLLLVAAIASVAVGVYGQGNQLQQIVIKICGERHFHVSEVVVDCAARVYGEKGMHMALRECLLTHLSGRDPEANLRVSPAAVEELCAWTNMSAMSSLRTDADVDKVVPYRAGSTFYCALSKLKITPREYIRSYEGLRQTRPESSHLAAETAGWCSQQEIERRIAQPTPSLRAFQTQEELILMRRADLERLQEEAQHELPSFTPCLCCTVTVLALVVSLLLLILVPPAHEWPLHLYPDSRKSRTADAPTSILSLDTEDDDITALSALTGPADLFAEPNVSATAPDSGYEKP